MADPEGPLVPGQSLNFILRALLPKDLGSVTDQIVSSTGAQAVVAKMG